MASSGGSRRRWGVHDLSNGRRIFLPATSPNKFAPGNLDSRWEDIDVFDVDTAARFPIGTQLRINNQVFMYCEFDATIAVGELVQASIPAAAHDALAAVAAAAGATSFSVTSPESGSDDFAANEYSGGMVYQQVNGTPGYGYPIWEHDALDISATATMVVTLPPGWNLAVAMAATDDLAFIKNPAQEVIQQPTTITAPVLGPTLAAQADGQFGWVGIKGPHVVLTEGTIVIGQEVRPSETTAGSVAALDYDEADDANLGNLGIVADVGATTEHSLVNFADINGLAAV